MDLALFFSSFYHLGLQSVKRSTISDALRKRSTQIWEDFYYSIISGLNRPARRRLAKKMHLIDSTIISLCLSNFDWAKYRKEKGTKHDAYPKTLRLVTFYHLESRKKLHFLTNNFSLAAQKIADI